MAIGDSLITSAASFNALDAFCSPSAAITFALASRVYYYFIYKSKSFCMCFQYFLRLTATAKFNQNFEQIQKKIKIL
jgi:hypothetical protein